MPPRLPRHAIAHGLRCACHGPDAQSLSRHKLGVIEAGSRADLLVLDGDPLRNLDLIGDPVRNTRLIMKAGRIHKNTLGAQPGRRFVCGRRVFYPVAS